MIFPTILHAWGQEFICHDEDHLKRTIKGLDDIEQEQKATAMFLVEDLTKYFAWRNPNVTPHMIDDWFTSMENYEAISQ